MTSYLFFQKGARRHVIPSLRSGQALSAAGAKDLLCSNSRSFASRAFRALAQDDKAPFAYDSTPVTTLADGEKVLIEAALKETQGRVAGRRGAAAKLGIPRQTLEWKIRALQIDKLAFRNR